ncbi:MAG: ErfK/YbiS/YcfS/YnhG family protein [Flavipsychrobacter sp.]|jgi:murein L,D-transpeptidase YcbB/YkuD|nr:ErfK/YbiS/YcfS/YnhG family protein [Flavipsychrobacter sp.]
MNGMRLVKSCIFYLLSVILLTIFFYPVFSKEDKPLQNNKTLYYPDETSDLYERIHLNPIWYTDIYSQVRQHFISVLDSAVYVGLEKSKYHYAKLKNANTNNSINAAHDAHIFIDAVIAYCKDLNGVNIGRQLNNDEVSRKYAASDEANLLDNLAKVNAISDMDNFLKSLEPASNEYTLLKNELKKQLIANNSGQTKQLVASLNYLRWINHFRFNKYIVVNIPSATLHYYEDNIPKLQMKVVVGKPSTPTPRFSTYCTQVILYPYWNVPKKIGANELLPKFIKNPSEMDEMDMHLIDEAGQRVDHHSLDWSAYDKNNFPYIFRQSTGCGNALGVIKFNLTNPFDVYMHDTNLKNKFLSTSRYFSHGCIRLEKPIDLANYLLREPIDSNMVKACMTDQQPTTKKLENAVPVFVVYMTPVAAAGAVTFNKDIYKLYQ